MSKKTSKIPKYTDDTIAYHINAMLSAVDHIDDILMQTQGDITPAILEEFPLQPLPATSFSLTEIHERIKHLQKLTAEPAAKVIEAQISPQFASILSIFSSLLKDEFNLQWYMYRIDEAEGVPQYYNIIPCPMYLGAIAARLQATLLDAEGFKIEDPREDLFSEYSQDSYGSAFSETIIKLDRRKRTILEQEVKKGTTESYKRACKEFYQGLSQKPERYESGEEVLRDLLLVGVDCMIFNLQGPLHEKAGQFLAEIKNLWTKNNLSSFWPQWADECFDEQGLYRKMKIWYMGAQDDGNVEQVASGAAVSQSKSKQAAEEQRAPNQQMESVAQCNWRAEMIAKVEELMGSDEIDIDAIMKFMDDRRIDQSAEISTYSDTDLKDFYKLLTQ